MPIVLSDITKQVLRGTYQDYFIHFGDGYLSMTPRTINQVSKLMNTHSSSCYDIAYDSMWINKSGDPIIDSVLLFIQTMHRQDKLNQLV